MFFVLIVYKNHINLVDCEMVKLWDIYIKKIIEEIKKTKEIEKTENEEADLKWIKNNTKNCPKCKISIEKNQGCNKMTCRKSAGGCGYIFCWICLKDWSLHNNCVCPKLIEIEKQFVQSQKIFLMM